MSPQLAMLLVLAYLLCINAFENTVTLNTSQEGGEGISMAITTPNVVTINNTWHIDPPTQDGTDLELTLQSEWGFHPSVESTINITIHGFTPNITKEDGECLMLFGVGDTQYFSMEISLEDGSAWSSYPSFENQPLAVTNTIFGDIIASSTPERRLHRLGNSSYQKDNWAQIGPGTWYKAALEWPLHIQITNDPINDKTYYRCFLPEKTLLATYTTSFATDEGMNIYIMNDASDGKPFDIYSIHVSYSYTTQSPTYTPTATPTITSISPTNTPNTDSPTNSPTTPSPIIVIPLPSTARPTNEGQQIDISSTITTVTAQHITSEDKSNDLLLYLVIVIVVLICCFAVVCLGFITVYKRKKKKIDTATFDAKQYHSPISIPDDQEEIIIVGMDGRVVVPSQSSLNMVQSQKLYKKYSHLSVSEDFADDLQNFNAGNAAIMGDVINDMVTKGGHDIDEEEYEQLTYIDPHINDEYEGNISLNGQNREKAFSNSNVMEGDGDTIVAISMDEKVNSLQDERTKNMCLQAVDTADGDIIIGDDYETIGGVDNSD